MRITKQTILRFAHGAESGATSLSSSRWKKALSVHSNLVFPWEHLFVRQGGTALTLGARDPAGSAWIDENAIEVMKAVASTAGKTIAVEMLQLSPACVTTSYRWDYHIPTWVVSKPGKDWAEWRKEHLGAQEIAGMLKAATADLTQQITSWGVSQDSFSSAPLNLQIEDPGRPMVLRDAVANGPKTVSAMARLDVRLSSDRRLEGALFAGNLKGLGFGRLFRAGSSRA